MLRLMEHFTIKLQNLAKENNVYREALIKEVYKLCGLVRMKYLYKTNCLKKSIFKREKIKMD